MTGKTCATCAYSMRRFRATKPRLWCKQYHQPAIEGGCIDHKARLTIKTVMQYLKTSSIK